MVTAAAFYGDVRVFIQILLGLFDVGQRVQISHWYIVVINTRSLFVAQGNEIIRGLQHYRASIYNHVRHAVQFRPRTHYVAANATDIYAIAQLAG